MLEARLGEDRVCARCGQQLAVPGQGMCSSCMDSDMPSGWTPSSNIHLADLDELENRPAQAQSGIVSRLIWWTLILLITAVVAALFLGKIHLTFLDNIPFFVEIRKDFSSIAGNFASSAQKLFSAL